ncbi:hypothetical protein Tco_0371440 [Tanacetum coccineum]
MMVHNQEEMGEGSAIPTDPHHTSTFIQPSPQPQKTQKPRRPKKKDTQVPQSSVPNNNVADKVVYKELDDSLVRAATTASSLEAEQDSGNITKTRSKVTLNEPSSLGTSSGSGPRFQETIGETIAQTGFESVSKHSNDPVLARANTLRSGEDSLKLNELMELCTSLQQRVLDLEKTNTTQVEEIVNEESLGEDASKQGRINAIDVDEDITLVNDQDDADMFDVNTLTGDEIKGDVIEEPNIPASAASKKDTIRLQAEFDEEERLAREKDEANVALTEEWDDIQAKVDERPKKETFVKRDGYPFISNQSFTKAGCVTWAVYYHFAISTLLVKIRDKVDHKGAKDCCLMGLRKKRCGANWNEGVRALFIVLATLRGQGTLVTSGGTAEVVPTGSCWFICDKKNGLKAGDVACIFTLDINLSWNLGFRGNFMPPTPDLSFTGLDEFVYKPVVENKKSDEEVSKVVRKSDDSPIIEDWVSDSEEENVSQTKTEKKTVKPSIVKKDFDKSKQQQKLLGKLLNKLSNIGKMLTVQEAIKEIGTI